MRRRSGNRTVGSGGSLQVAAARAPQIRATTTILLAPILFTGITAGAKDHPPAQAGGCLDCHAAVRRYKVLHSPVKDKACDGCHEIPAAGGPAKLTEAPEKLCLMCHDAGQFRAANVHGPVAVGACVACHNPHGADTQALTRDSGASLCLNCHSDMQTRISTAKFQHKPVTEGCVSCHDPHASAQKFQLKMEAGRLCASCHPAVAQQADTAAVKHVPVADKRACLNCHDPHGAEVRPQLRTDGVSTCLSCHDRKLGAGAAALPDMKKLLAENRDHHGPIREKDCSGCHLPHGSEQFRLLKERYPKEFYAPFQAGNFALCFECHDSALARDEHTTTLTDFRDGDRNLHFVHVNRTAKGRTCRSCHEVHASNLPNHIRKSVPFGSWELPINFSKKEQGGSCAPGCHAPVTYDRRQKTQ